MGFEWTWQMALLGSAHKILGDCSLKTQGAQVPKSLAAKLSDKHLITLYVNKLFMSATPKYWDLGQPVLPN